MRGSLLIEIHPWRGLSASQDLFVAFVVIGFLTIGISRHTITDRLRALLESVRKLRDGIQ